MKREAGAAAYETADDPVNRYACANDSDSRRLHEGQEEGDIGACLTQHEAELSDACKAK